MDQLRFLVWRIRNGERELIAAFADYLEALDYAADYVDGEFTSSEVEST